MNLRRASRLAVLASLGALRCDAASAATPEPALRLDHRTRCPSAVALRRRLDEGFRLRSRGTELWTLRVERRAAQLVLALRGPSGEGALERTLPGADCAALSDAVAIILEAHFLQLALPPRLDPRRPPRAPPSPPPVRPPPATPPVRRRYVGVALGGGLLVGIEPGSLAPAGALGVTLQPWALPLGLRVAVILAHPSEQTAQRDRLDLRPLLVRGELTARLGGGRLFFEPALGAGVGLFQVSAKDLPGQPMRWRAQALLGGTVGGGVRLGAAFALRLDLGLFVFPVGDRYLVTPEGEVGRSPRLLFLGSLGLEVGRKW
ncbi:MAG: hypothetical protein IT371_09490 [Deltaproteobacteria bacterium]|nr:hypothetical protein [Deltaproteobacteria bacterium]